MILDSESVAEWLSVLEADGRIGQETLSHCERLLGLIDVARSNTIPLRSAVPASFPDDTASTALEAFDTWRTRLNERIEQAGGGFRLAMPTDPKGPLNKMECWFEGQARGQADILLRTRQAADFAEDTFVDTVGTPRTGREEPVDVQTWIMDWILHRNDSPIAIVLGDWGTGKSFHCRKFVLSLIQKNEDPEFHAGQLPIPIYFDLRRVRQLFFSETPHLRSRRFDRADVARLMECALDEFQESGFGNDIVTFASSHPTVLVFDGFDEIASSLHPDEAGSLLQAISSFARAPADERRGTQILISARTHYFRNRRQQDALLAFRSPDRAGSASNPEIITLDLLQQEQLEAVVSSHCDLSTPDLLFSSDVLRQMAPRPFWITAICARINRIPPGGLTSAEFSLIGFLEDLIDDALSREETRQVFDADVKKQLLVRLAGAIWMTGKTAWPASELNAWLDDQLISDPRLNDLYSAPYKGKSRELLYEDLRTSTFLVRDEDDRFRFGDEPVRGYFLAHYLYESTRDGNFDTWDAGKADMETKTFISEIVFGRADAKDRKAFLDRIGSILRSPYKASASEIAFDIALKAQARNDPDAPTGGFEMPDADLTRLGTDTNGTRFELSNSNFAGAKLNHVHLRNANLNGCNLAGAEIREALFEDCDFSEAILDGAVIEQAIFRACLMSGIKPENADFSDCQFIFNDGLGKDARNALQKGQNALAPAVASVWSSVKPRRDHIRIRNGSSRHITHCVYSSDGKLVLSATEDGSMRLWEGGTGAERQVLVGHSAAVTCCTFSADNKSVLSGSRDFTVRAWDCRTGRQKTRFTGHDHAITCCAFDPNGEWAVSGDETGLLKLWDLNSTEVIHTLANHEGAVNSCAVSSDGDRVASASSDSTIRIWNSETGSEEMVLEGHAKPVSHCRFSPDGEILASISEDHTIRIWNTADGESVAVLADHQKRVQACAFSPDADILLSASDDKTIRVWDTQTGKQLKSLSGHTGPVTDCRFSSDGQIAISTSEDGTMRLWQTGTWSPLTTFAGHETAVNGCGLSADGHHIVSYSADGTMRVWDAARKPDVGVLEGHKDWIHKCSFSPDGQRVVSAARDNTLRLWDSESGAEIAVLSGHRNWVQCCAFSPDGIRLVSGSDDNTLRLWDGTTGEAISRLDGHKGSVYVCTYSPDGARILSGSDDGSLRLWDGTTGHQIAVLRGHSNWVRSAAFNADGTRVISGSFNGNLRLWDGETGSQLSVFKGHEDSITCCIFNTNQGQIISGSNDATVRIWDMETGSETAILTGHTAPITGLALSPDGRLILSASTDSTLRIWDCATARELHVLAGHEGPVTDCTFSPGGDRVLSSSEDHTLRLWDSRAGVRLTTLKGHLGFVKSCGFSPDGSRIVSGSYDNSLRLWDGNAGCEISTCYHTAESGYLTLSRTDDKVVSASGNAWKHFYWSMPENGTGESILPLEADPEIGLIPVEGLRLANS